MDIETYSKLQNLINKLDVEKDRIDNLYAYLGLNADDIIGLQVDYKNKTCKRILGAVNLSDLNKIPASITEIKEVVPLIIEVFVAVVKPTPM